MLTVLALKPRGQCPHLQVAVEQGAPVGLGQLQHGVPVNAAVAVLPRCKEAVSAAGRNFYPESTGQS